MSAESQLSHRVDRIPVAAREGGANGTVVSAREESTRAGLEMLDRGGNAIDAAVAAALVAGVIEPMETTLAGCGFMLLHHPVHGAWSVDFGPLAPLDADSTMFELDPDAESSNVLGLAPVVDMANVFGPLASGVPRTLLALTIAQERWGELDRELVFAPAIRLAREGFAADAWFVMNAMQDLERLAADPGCREVFLDEDGLPRGRRSAAPYGLSVGEADRVTQLRLAQTLETVAAEGPRALIDGAIADDLASTSKELGMRLSAADLRRAEPRIERPRSLDFRGHTVWAPNAPGGGTTVLEILSIWSKLISENEAGDLSRAERLRLLSRAIRHAFADRYHWLGDPEVVPVPTDALLSEEYAAVLAEICSREEWAVDDDVPPWTRFASHAIHDPWRFDPEGRSQRWNPAGANEPTSGTTHVSAAGTDGWVVSITHTAANHFGSAVLCRRTGLLFDAAMAWFNAVPGAANSIAGGARPVANMAPALVTGPSRAAALGASGGRRIISAVAQLVLELAENDRSAADALAVPRIDASGSRVVVHELDFEAAVQVAELDSLVVPHTSMPHQLDFARASIATVDANGAVASAIDARAYGW